MIDEGDLRILDILSRRLVAKPGEISVAFGGSDGVTPSLHKLLAMDCIKVIEPIGEKCYVITQKGAKLLKESVSPDRQQHKQGFLTA